MEVEAAVEAAAEAEATVVTVAVVVTVVKQEVLIIKRLLMLENIQVLSMVEDHMECFILTIYHQITTPLLDITPQFIS